LLAMILTKQCHHHRQCLPVWSFWPDIYKIRHTWSTSAICRKSCIEYIPHPTYPKRHCTFNLPSTRKGKIRSSKTSPTITTSLCTRRRNKHGYDIFWTQSSPRSCHGRNVFATNQLSTLQSHTRQSNDYITAANNFFRHLPRIRSMCWQPHPSRSLSQSA
jgi:hypothetical protein